MSRAFKKAPTENGSRMGIQQSNFRWISLSNNGSPNWRIWLRLYAGFVPARICSGDPPVGSRGLANIANLVRP